MISPATVDLIDDLGIYVNASYSLQLTFEDESSPIDLTGFTIDADIKDPVTDGAIGTWTTAILAPLDGESEMTMAAAYTLTLPPGLYSYDLSLTSPSGERYYWMRGKVEVYKTISRP